MFGQDGPNYSINCSSQQTICRKLNIFPVPCTPPLGGEGTGVINMILQNTIYVSNQKLDSFIVRIFVIFNNPQITKAQLYLITRSRDLYNKGSGMLVGISETIRLLLTKKNSSNSGVVYFVNHTAFGGLTLQGSTVSKRLRVGIFTHGRVERGISNKNLSTLTSAGKGVHTGDSFNEWLAGLIDGDGCFQLSKKGYASLEIVMETRDKHCLYIIKQKFGGAVKLRSGVNFLRYRLHHKEGLLKLINAVNGLIRNPTRMVQLNKICEKYNINFKYPSPLTYSSGWLAGFIDSDGSIY